MDWKEITRGGAIASRPASYPIAKTPGMRRLEAALKEIKRERRRKEAEEKEQETGEDKDRE